jgi:hypothetical protein
MTASDWENDFGGMGGASRPPVGSSPPLLTGGIPRTESEISPTSAPEEVREYSHGGYDGGIEVGFDGTWNPLKFPDLLETLESAKNRAAEVEKGPEGFIITLGGEEVLVMPTGGRAGGLLYKYRIMCRGVEILIHSNPPQGRQPVRIRYLAESVQGGRDRFFNTHNEFVLPFLKRLGLVIHTEKLSRVDAQVMFDVDVKEIIRLCEDGHLTSKLRKGSIDFKNGFCWKKETLTLGSVSKVEVCIYDKGKELRAKKKNIVKEADFISHCVGDEWINSGRPITRVEFRLGRDALKALGVNTVADLQERERAIFDLLTMDWFRILKDPKVRGHENTAALHPIWERVRMLFNVYFSGSAVETVEWQRKDKTSCDSFALKRQAMGCLAKAFAYDFGSQVSSQSTVDLATRWAEGVQKDFHEKLNVIAEHVEIKTGLTLGISTRSSMDYEYELDYRNALDDAVVRKKQEEVEKWLSSEQGVLR